MTKLHKKLLVILSAIACSLCFVFGVSACKIPNKPDDNGGEHEHTFGGLWLFDGEEGHYQLATCHPEVKSELEAHVDGDEDEECDVCGFDMSAGGGEQEHTHEYSEEWTFNELMHWHNATCEHFTERSDYDDHNFVAGVCECGVKESEVKVYDLYKNSPEYDLYFTQWLEWLKENNVVSVEYTQSGDGIYHYVDGHSEVRFLGERTLKVQAVTNRNPPNNAMPYVWVMVAMYQPAENSYFESNGTIALGIAETDSFGIAEITFRPVGGYSSDKVEYRIRIAERKDIAVLQGVTEENASLPFPNRYLLKGGSEGFEYMPYEVSENANSDDIAATLEFVYSAGWNDYETIFLPYRRYWEDQVNGTGLQEQGTTYQFTSSGDNLFDYFIFSPQQYDYSQGGTVDQNLQIVENAKIACSGVYTISFTVDKNANAQLYYWNEEGVNLGGNHYTNSDGTPADRYITEKTEGDINYVTVEILPSLGLRYYQLGIKTDIECNVTITVERTGDVSLVSGTFEWDNQTNKSEIVVDIIQNETISFELKGVPAGLYTLTIPRDASQMSQNMGRFYAWTDTDEQKICVWEPRKYKDVYGVNKAIISIADNTNFIYLQNLSIAEKQKTIILEKYELPVVTDEFAAVPVTPATYDNSYTLPLSVASGSYKLSIWIANVVNGGEDKPLSVCIGDKTIQITMSDTYVTGGGTFYYYIATIEIGEGDNTISIRCSTEYSFTAGVEIKLIHECNDVCSECNKCLTDCKEPECADKCQGHGADVLIHEFEGFTIAAGSTRSLSLSEIKNYVTGTFYLVAETETEAANGKLSIIIENNYHELYPYDMFMPIANVFKVRLDTQQCNSLNIKNTSDSDIIINSLKLVKYEAFTIEAGEDYVIQSNYSFGFDKDLVSINPELAGKQVTITISNWDTGAEPPSIWHGQSQDDFVDFTESNKIADGVYQVTVTIPAGETLLTFANWNEHCRNIVVRIDIVE